VAEDEGCIVTRLRDLIAPFLDAAEDVRPDERVSALQLSDYVDDRLTGIVSALTRIAEVLEAPARTFEALTSPSPDPQATHETTEGGEPMETTPEDVNQSSGAQAAEPTGTADETNTEPTESDSPTSEEATPSSD
jgi:hypothetical protein